MIYQERVDRVIKNMKEAGLSQILITFDPSLKYLFGQVLMPFERCGAVLLKDNGQIHAFLNRMFHFDPEGMEAHYYSDGENPYSLIASYLEPGKVGFDDKWMSKHTIGVLSERSDITPVWGSLPVDLTKMIKDEEEKDRLRHAGRINDMAVEFGIKHIKEGRSELELADMIEAFFEEHGAAKEDQFQLSGYGANAANPHHVCDDISFIKEGDCCLFDLWAPINGYWCDMSRTVFYKSVSDEHRKIYETVKEAQQAAIDFIRPGVKMSEIDGVARKIITDAGYGDKFTHRLGHGVGMTVHEWPEASASCDLICQEGMCFSVEPGIYIEGEMGVRIEDLVLVTKDGCEVLTHYPKDLQIVE